MARPVSASSGKRNNRPNERTVAIHRSSHQPRRVSIVFSVEFQLSGCPISAVSFSVLILPRSQVAFSFLSRGAHFRVFWLSSLLSRLSALQIAADDGYGGDKVADDI